MNNKHTEGAGQPLSRQRGGIARTLAILVGVVVLAGAGLVYLATKQLSAEDLAVEIATEIGGTEGEVPAQAPFLQRGSTEAQGRIVVTRWIILDNWTEHMDEETHADLSAQPNSLETLGETMLAAMADNIVSGWCTDTAVFNAFDSLPDVGFRAEVLDERGAVLARVEQPDSKYCFG